MKDLVYRDRAEIANAEDLRQRIFAAVERIREEMQEININRRLDACIRVQESCLNSSFRKSDKVTFY